MGKTVHGINLAAPGGLAKLFAYNRSIYGDLRMDAAVIVPRGRLGEIITRQESINTDISNLETQEDTPENQLRADTLLEEFQELEVEKAPLVTRAQQIADMKAKIAAERAGLEQGSDPGATGGDPLAGGHASRMAGSTGPRLHTRQTVTDPFADMESIRNGTMGAAQVRSRALQVVETYHQRDDIYMLADDSAARCAELIEKGGKQFGTAVARQMLATGSAEYLAAFEQYLVDPGGYATRAALSLTSANGGYLVPFTLDPTIILTNAGSANPYRQVATVKTTTTNDWNGVTSAGVSAEWTAEGIEAADASPTVGQLKIVPQKADAYLFGSFEVLGDSDFAAQLPELLADAKDRIEESAFAVGTGSPGQPWGVIPRGTSQNRAGTAAAGPAGVDAYSLQAALPARWRSPRANNVWLMNLITMNVFRNTPKFTGSTESILVDGPGGPTMLGKPVLESTSILGTYTTGNKVMAYLDARQYYIVDRVGMSVVYDPIVLGANRRPTGQGAWYSFWRVGADVSTASAVRVFATLT